ncbi:hypothetical protein [Ekhidna lutea]|uniref:hypothetical protein n=1 Tax=Ekhidna lutea TaxID=447679 RepID=UPI00117BF006|nr:hypothetical protein [Ekhidna lutea]
MEYLYEGKLKVISNILTELRSTYQLILVSFLILSCSSSTTEESSERRTIDSLYSSDMSYLALLNSEDKRYILTILQDTLHILDSTIASEGYHTPLINMSWSDLALTVKVDNDFGDNIRELKFDYSSNYTPKKDPKTKISQITLTDKIYLSGSERHFNNSENCEFYFPCDCCMGKLLFTSASNYMLVNYCMSDFVVTKGTYEMRDGSITLNSDGSRIDVKYNYEREANPDAKPAFFVEGSTTSGYQLNYRIDTCTRTMLVSERDNGTFIAIETDLQLTDELEHLKEFQLAELLELK